MNINATRSVDWIWLAFLMKCVKNCPASPDDWMNACAICDTDKKGLSAESVLRIALLKQRLQCDYDQEPDRE
jgi:hypothetical protein